MTTMFLPLDPADPCEPTTSTTSPHLSEDADGIPHDFQLHPDGVWLDRETEDGDVIPVRLCSPLRVTAICRRMDGSGWGRLVQVMDPDGRWHELMLDASENAGSEVRLLKPLMGRGLTLARGRDIRKMVCELIEDWKPRRRVTLIDKVGWVDVERTGFALGNGSVLGTGDVMLTGAARDMSGSFRSKGSLEDWQRKLAGPCRSNPIAMLALSQAFVGPLLNPLGMDSGGFHLFGDTTCGKSTLVRVAVSVWGAPDMKYSWRTTDNALEPMAAARCDMLMALDEIAQIDGAKLGDAIYMLGNGQGKGRMLSDGRCIPPLHWHVAMLSSGEIDIAAQIASCGKKTYAGHGVRLVDVVADGGRYGAFEDLHGAATTREFATALNAGSADLFGTAGPAFVEALMSKPTAIVKASNLVEGFCTRATTHLGSRQNTRVARIVKHFALAAAAGELATEFGLTGWTKGEALKAMFDLAQTNILEKQDREHHPADTAIQKTAAWIRDHGTDCLARLTDGSAVSEHGWVDDEHFYLLPGTWRRIHGATEREAARLHREADLLHCNEGTLQYRMPRAVPGQPRVYAVRRRPPVGDGGSAPVSTD